MKQRYIWGLALIALLTAAAAWGAAATAAKPAPTTLGNIVITSDSSETTLPGTVIKWTKNVSVTAEGAKLTCDSLKGWRSRSGKDFERLEATGNVHISARQTTSDGVTWRIEVRAQSASYDHRTGLGELKGKVHIRAVDISDGSAGSIEADLCTYDRKTQLLHFRHEGKQVQWVWEPAPEQAKIPPAAPAPGPAPK